MSSSERPTPTGSSVGDESAAEASKCTRSPQRTSSILLEESSLRALAEKLAGCLLRARNGVAS